MSKFRHRSLHSSGLTIVETLIVLAIAGLILLIVFQAIPALERGSRNNSRRQDIQAILEAVSHWELNNSGNIPHWDPLNTLPGGPGCDDFLQFYLNRLSYYIDTANSAACSIANANIMVTLAPTALGSGIVTEPPNFNTTLVYLYNHQKCKETLGSTGNGASYSDIVALYAIESGNGSSSSQCQQL